MSPRSAAVLFTRFGLEQAPEALELRLATHFPALPESAEAPGARSSTARV
jgi:hypothetical protein